MANRAAPALVLRDGDRDRLERLTRSSTVSAGAAQRSRIVLLAADGVANDQICELVGCGRQKVLQWRGRYEAKGLAGLADQKRPTVRAYRDTQWRRNELGQAHTDAYSKNRVRLVP